MRGNTTIMLMIKRARALRKNQTDAERKLWYALRNRQVGGYKFRRQCPIGSFIVDFCCEEAFMIVEIDGSQHGAQLKKDALRTRYLVSKGYRVIRFGADAAVRETTAVLETILRELKGSPHPLRLRSEHPLPKGEGKGVEYSKKKLHHYTLPKLLVFISTLLVLFSGVQARSATFMVGSANPTARVGEEVVINVGVDTQGARLNLFNLTLPLPDEVEFVDFDNTNSIVSVWVREPVFDAQARKVSLIGGVPGGALGRVVLTTVKLRPQVPGIYQFSVAPEAEAYLNDGLGTKAEVSVAPWTLEVQGRPRTLLIYIIVLAAVVLLVVVWYLWHRSRNNPPIDTNNKTNIH